MYSGPNNTFQRISDQQVFSITQTPDALRQLRYRRLLFLLRLLKAAPDALLHVLDASPLQSGSYASTIIEDLEWLGQHSFRISEMQAPPDSLYEWLLSVPHPHENLWYVMPTSMTFVWFWTMPHTTVCYMT